MERWGNDLLGPEVAHAEVLLKRAHPHALRVALAVMALASMIAGVEAAGPKSASAGSYRRIAVATPVRRAPVVAPTPAIVQAVAPTPAPPPVAPTVVGPKRVMLIGDSMAFTAADGLAPHAPQFGVNIINEGIFGCGLVRGGPYRYFGAEHAQDASRCDQWPTQRQAAVERNRPDLTAIVVGRWELMDRVHDGVWTNVHDPAFVAYLETELDHAINVAASTGGGVVLFTTPYYLRAAPRGGGRFPEDDPARVDIVNAMIRRVAERRLVPLIDVGGFLSPDGHYSRDVGGVRVRSDGVHLTRQTGSVLAPWLVPQLRALIPG